MNLNLENKKIAEGFKLVIGCDEVGRGCLAGPVVACAVVLPQQVESKKLKVIKSLGIKDSKLLTSSQREKISPLLKEICLWSIGIVSEKEIDRINIHNASLLAMRKAVEGLQLFTSIPSASDLSAVALAKEEESLKALNTDKGSFRSDAFGRDEAVRSAFIYIDGKFQIPNFPISQQAVVGGDNKVMSIAAASIIAKVCRDELMQEFEKQFPNYEFGKHKGYATALHRSKIKKHGLCSIHRLSFCKNYIV